MATAPPCPSVAGGLLDSKDGRTVYFSARVAGQYRAVEHQLRHLQRAGDRRRCEEPHGGNPAWDAQPMISPDGLTKLAYKAMKRPGYEADRFQLKVMDLATGKVTDVAADWDRSASSLAWSRDGKSLLVTADDQGSHRSSAST
jgi:Tol biopolymer transport system component